MKHTKLKPFRTTAFAFWLSLLSAILAILGYIYLFNSIKTVGQNIADLEQETSVLQAQEAEVDTLKKNLAATQQSQQKLTSYFIDSNNIIPFLETVEGYGKTTNVVVKFTNVNINQSPESLAVAFTADGTFENLYRFTALLEAAPYEFTIGTSNMQLSSSLTPDPTIKVPVAATWELQMNLSVVSVSQGLPAPMPVQPATAAPAGTAPVPGQASSTPVTIPPSMQASATPATASGTAAAPAQ